MKTTQPGKKVSQAVEGFNLYLIVVVRKAAQSTYACRRYRWTTLAAMMAAYNANYAPPDILVQPLIQRQDHRIDDVNDPIAGRDVCRNNIRILTE